MTFEEAAALMIRGGKTKEIDITKNGDYTITDEEKAEGYMGYNPLHVNVAPNLTTITITENGEYDPPSGYDGYIKVIANVSSTASIQELTVTEPGIYNAVDYGCNGFDPVIVSDVYKKLYEQATGGGESIDSGVTDPNGDEVILDNAIETDWDAIKYIEIDEGGVTLTEPNTGLQLKFYAETSSGSKWLQYELSNLKTGESVSNIASRGRYDISSGVRITFKIVDYRLEPGYFQVYPGDVYKNGALYPSDYWAHFYPYFYSSEVGISGGFTSGSVIIQASY